MSKLISFISESIHEMRHKVTWPTYQELQDSSRLVLVASLIFALIVGLVDFSFKGLVSWFYNKF